MRNEPWIHKRGSLDISISSVSMNLIWMSSKKFNPFKDFLSHQIQRSSCKIFTTHYVCRNADLNLTLATGTTNRFIFQITNSLIDPWGVCLTCRDCKPQYCLPFWDLIITETWDITVACQTRINIWNLSKVNRFQNPSKTQVKKLLMIIANTVFRFPVAFSKVTKIRELINHGKRLISLHLNWTVAYATWWPNICVWQTWP